MAYRWLSLAGLSRGWKAGADSAILDFQLISISIITFRNSPPDRGIPCQLMRAYTLSILANLGDGHPVLEKQIVAWANGKISEVEWDKKCRFGIR
jgi:hypothetical protein